MIVYQDNLITLRQGHIITELRSLPSESVHMCVTSPPYWGLRDYGLEPQVWDDFGIACPDCLGTGHEGGKGRDQCPSCSGEGQYRCEHEWGDEAKQTTEQWGHGPNRMNDLETGHRNPRDTGNITKKEISQGQFCRHCNAWKGSLGLEPTPELYIQHIVQVFQAVKRVLLKDGTCWVNIGDSYASVHTGGHKSAKSTVGANKEGVQEIKQFKAAPSTHGLKEKDLCMIPARVALALQADGWWLRSDIIWSKSNPMPESVTDRPTRAHEYVFLLTKSAKYFYDADAVREPQADTKYTRERYKYKPSSKKKDKSNLDTNWQGDELAKHFGQGGRNLRSVWTIATQPFKDAHFATFPEKLASTCIKAGTSEKGCCPECGSAWVRIIEKMDPERRNVKSDYPGDQTLVTSKYKHGESGPQSKTIGWKKNCSCKLYKIREDLSKIEIDRIKKLMEET